MKNIVLCFDRTQDQQELVDATNAEVLFHLLEDTDDQLTWYHPGTPATPQSHAGPRAALHWRETFFEDARATIIEAYEFIAASWEPGDRIFMFGIGRGAYCARAVTRLLGSVGVLPWTDDLFDYVVHTYALSRTDRTAEDWQRITEMSAGLAEADDVAVPVEFLGLWDAVKVPGLPRMSTAESLTNVVAGRHAMAIDGGPFGERLAEHDPDVIEEVWFRGAHCDVTGETGACFALADIALDWMVDGALDAGILLRADRDSAPAPSEADALAGHPRHVWLRKLPADALVHASVDLYLRAHPQYWRRLPAHVLWADVDWLSRSERLLPGTTAPISTPTPVAEAEEPAEAAELAAVAS